MVAQIIGISGSPVPNSNTDRAVRLILEQTGLETEFVKLCELDLQPCRACRGCVENNRCVVGDDGRELSRKFQRAQGFVLGGYTSYSSLDARTKTFMERMFCLRHQNGQNRAKVGVSVITTAVTPGADALPPAAETASAQIAFWMLQEGIHNLGGLVIEGNVPCLRCDHGDDCEMSGIRLIHGPHATRRSVSVRGLEHSPSLQNEARQLGRQLCAAVLTGAHI